MTYITLQVSSSASQWASRILSSILANTILSSFAAPQLHPHGTGSAGDASHLLTKAILRFVLTKERFHHSALTLNMDRLTAGCSSGSTTSRQGIQARQRATEKSLHALSSPIQFFLSFSRRYADCTFYFYSTFLDNCKMRDAFKMNENTMIPKFL